MKWGSGGVQGDKARVLSPSPMCGSHSFPLPTDLEMGEQGPAEGAVLESGVLDLREPDHSKEMKGANTFPYLGG